MKCKHPPLPCPDCAGKMYLQAKPLSWGGKPGLVYLCENRPQCRGLMSAHPDGSPMGTPVPAAVRRARRIVHACFDPLWQSAHELYGPECELSPRKLQRIARNRAYKWLAAHSGIPEEDCHMARMSIDQLRQAWRTIKHHNPTAESVRAWAKEIE